MIQEIIVGIIGILVIGWMLYKALCFFLNKSETKGSCGCSNCHCNMGRKKRIISR